MEAKQKRKEAENLANTYVNLSPLAQGKMLTWMEGFAAGYRQKTEESNEAPETAGKNR